MTDPYAVIDANYDKMYDMIDPAEKCRESIIEQLLREGIADYCNNKQEHKQLFLDKIKEEYADVIEEGMSIRDVIEAEAKRIAESIF